jgi:hypothetical protein
MCKYYCIFVKPMLLYTPHITPRIQYIVNHLSKFYFNIAITITDKFEEFENYKGVKINYSNNETLEGLHIHPAGLMQMEAVQVIDFKTVEHNGIHCPFAVNKGQLPFDVFSAIFYLITRYEEYLPHQQNKYGQFMATASFAYKNNFLHLPVVDSWVNDLKMALQQKFPSLSFLPKKFTAQMTYDIDVAYAYRGKSFFKNTALLARDFFTLNFATLKNRIASLQKIEKDVFNTFNYIIESNNELQKPILFFLVGDAHQYNKNLDWQTNEMQELLNSLKEKVTIGIHPSYETPRNKKLIIEEKNRLEKLTNTTVALSRQHYLRYYMPTTYNHLYSLGITNDYTMGYADLPGFRASTSMPFYFYDVVNDVQTNLLLHPITFMEGTYAEDLALQPTDALPNMIALLNEVKKVNGNFICIWHNHSLSNIGFWKGWKNVHNKIVEEIKK